MLLLSVFWRGFRTAEPAAAETDGVNRAFKISEAVTKVNLSSLEVSASVSESVPRAVGNK